MSDGCHRFDAAVRALHHALPRIGEDQAEGRRAA
jgi:hypothetical protein